MLTTANTAKMTDPAENISRPTGPNMMYPASPARSPVRESFKWVGIATPTHIVYLGMIELEVY